MENTAGFVTRLRSVKVLVLDKAGHLLNMGFRKDVERIIAAVPKQRQTLLFSATVPEEVRQVCHIALKRDHEFINTVQGGSEDTHSQRYLVAPLEKQFSVLYVLLKEHIADDVDYKVGLPADDKQYIHRLGRTGCKGKEGEGILLLAPWEEFFSSKIKSLPITKASEPSVDPDTKKKVECALSNVEMKTKESAYQAWLGYYNVGRDKYRLVELANEFSHSMGLDNPPAIPKLILGKLGLRNVPGLCSR